jgi:Polyketide cyclase / dehydrase and lipid transport
MGNFVHGTRDTSAPAEVVWGLLVDVDGWALTFTPHLKAAHLNGPLAVGTSGWVATKFPLPRSWFTVTSVEDGRSWRWRGRLLWLWMDFDHVVAPAERGCRVTFDVDLNGRLAAVVRPVAGVVYGRQMERALDLLVRAAESASGPRRA